MEKSLYYLINIVNIQMLRLSFSYGTPSTKSSHLYQILLFFFVCFFQGSVRVVEDEVVAEVDSVTVVDGEDSATAEDGEDSEEEVRVQGMEKTITCCNFCYRIMHIIINEMWLRISSFHQLQDRWCFSLTTTCVNYHYGHDTF